MSQIALPLSHKGVADPDRIVVGTANAHVVEALRKPETWPFKTAILSGETRSGKSLLGRWFSALGHGELIDGADAVNETELFHSWNRAQESGTALLLISDAVDGFYSPVVMMFVYLGFLGGPLIGHLLLAKRRTLPRFLVAVLSAAIVFFLVSNFGMWLSGIGASSGRNFSGGIVDQCIE